MRIWLFSLLLVLAGLFGSANAQSFFGDIFFYGDNTADVGQPAVRAKTVYAVTVNATTLAGVSATSTGNSTTANASVGNSTTTNGTVTSQAWGTQALATNATLGATSATYVLVDTSAGNLTATVNGSASAGRTWIFIDSTSDWDATHALAVNVTSGGNINGVDQFSSTTANGSIRVMSDGAGNYHTW